MAGLAPARYFPVKSTPFRFVAGLSPFGTDFGNGAREAQYFQADAQRERYLREKREVPRERHAVLARSDDERRVHDTVLRWLHRQLGLEHPGVAAGVPLDYRAISAVVQEDLVVLHRRADGSDAAIMVDVSFPSDWYPDRIVDTGFRFIHGPVPGFADGDAQAAAMVSAMIDRGPYVRFVWTLSPDDHLDHHPVQGRHAEWSLDGEGWLRVERQLTVPFAQVQASLFLIRTYLYSFASLAAEERATLRRAIETMPPAAAGYKRFTASRDIIFALLA